MAKLKSVLANLKSTFEDYDFAFIEPVSYIKALSNETDKIIFVYKYVCWNKIGKRFIFN